VYVSDSDSDSDFGSGVRVYSGANISLI